MDKTLELISGYAASLSYEDLPDSAIRAAKHRIIDSLGCALGAYHAEPCKIARRLCYPTGCLLTARVIGSLKKTTPEMAAFANSIMVRYLDFNDSYRAKDGGHPSDAIPAVLAVAEAVQADGKSLITAIVLAYEMAVRIIEESPLDERGWDQPVYIVLGSALGAGKLLGLSREQLANAAALALVPNIAMYQSRIGELSMWKAGAAGMAARQGIFAALMAREGMTGPEEAFEGKYGLFNQVTGPMNLEPLGGKRTQFGVERPNLKYYPVRDSIQFVIDTVLDLRKQVSPGDIKSLYAKTYASAIRTAVESKQLWAPQTRETADHSQPFCIAAAILDGDITAETFSRERYLDQDLLDMIGKLKIEEDPEYSKQTPAKRNFYIEATTHSGETYSAHRILTADDLKKGWSDEQVKAKFRGLARDILTPSQTQASLDIFWHLEELDDTAKILDNLEA
ncbi:MAG: MmgE/PrpD family protein [Pseudomonadota bacterium]